MACEYDEKAKSVVCTIEDPNSGDGYYGGNDWASNGSHTYGRPNMNGKESNYDRRTDSRAPSPNRKTGRPVPPKYSWS